MKTIKNRLLYTNQIKLPDNCLTDCPKKGKSKRCLGKMTLGDYFCRNCYLNQKSYKNSNHHNATRNERNYLDKLQIRDNTEF